jgi:hypothetical protein
MQGVKQDVQPAKKEIAKANRYLHFFSPVPSQIED